MNHEPWKQIISTEEIIEIHRCGILKYQDISSIDPPSPQCIEKCLGNAWSAHLYNGEDTDYSLTFVSFLSLYLTRNHCFIDGNKRVAWMTAMRIFKKMGIKVNATEDEAIFFMLDIANGKIKEGEDISYWFSEHFVADE